MSKNKFFAAIFALRIYRLSSKLFPSKHSRDSCGDAEHDHRDLDKLYRQEREHAALGLELPGGNAQEYEVHDNLGQNAEYAPLPRKVEEYSAPWTHEHPNVVCVNEREQKNVRFAFVVRAVAAPAGALVKELFPRVYRGGLDYGILVEIVADLRSRDFHHLVDEHVVIAAREVDEVSESADFKEQVLLVCKASRTCDNRAAKAKARRFHRRVAERFEFLVEVRHRACAVVLLGALHNADAIDKSPGHGGNPALARDAVGVHRQEHFVFGNLEGAFEGALLGACDLR